MKAKYILGMLLVLIAATACVYAEDATIDDDYKFTLPDKYTVDSQTDEYFDLKMDENHMISIRITDDVTSDNDTIKGLENQGYNVTGSQILNYSGKQISEIRYQTDSSQFYLYSWKLDNDDDYAIVAYGIPVDEGDVDWNSSPAKTIFDTISEI